MGLVHKELTPSVYSFISDMQVGCGGGEEGDGVCVWKRSDDLHFIYPLTTTSSISISNTSSGTTNHHHHDNNNNTPGTNDHQHQHPSLLQEVGADAPQGRKGASARIKRELQHIPRLVFLVEEWEKQLVAAGKAGGWPARGGFCVCMLRFKCASSLPCGGRSSWCMSGRGSQGCVAVECTV